VMVFVAKINVIVDSFWNYPRFLMSWYSQFSLTEATVQSFFIEV
jgi:hypothetical protein